MTTIYFSRSISHLYIPHLPPHRLPSVLLHRRLCLLPSSPRFHRRSSAGTTTTSIQRAEVMRPKESCKSRRVRLRLRLDHQVEFGEEVMLLGSSTELGSWRNPVPMEWTEVGWTCELNLRVGEPVDFKFVIKRDMEMVWEEGGNRVLTIPESGLYDLVCWWNQTRGAVNLLAVEREESEVDGDGGGSSVEDDRIVAETAAEASSFTEQLLGKDAAFMLSNEHEMERRWDTEGLDAVALKLVEGDKSAMKEKRLPHLLLTIYPLLRFCFFIRFFISNNTSPSDINSPITDESEQLAVASRRSFFAAR